MAALRHASRNLLHHHRSAQSSTAAVQRRLVHDAGGAPNNADRKARILDIQEKLQVKKQELYNLLAEVERERHYMVTPRICTERFRNSKLLQCLSVQVAPRPDDPKWRFYRNSHVMNGVLVCGAAAVLVHAGYAAAVRQWEHLNFESRMEPGTAEACS